LHQINNRTAMLVISSREFRDNQKKYFDSVDNGEQVIVQRGKDRSYKLVPVTSHDICMTEEEFYEKIDRSIQQAKEGKVLKVSTNDGLKNLLGL
jgi:antitoxin YefM